MFGLGRRSLRLVSSLVAAFRCAGGCNGGLAVHRIESDATDHSLIRQLFSLSLPPDRHGNLHPPQRHDRLLGGAHLLEYDNSLTVLELEEIRRQVDLHSAGLKALATPHERAHYAEAVLEAARVVAKLGKWPFKDSGNSGSE